VRQQGFCVLASVSTRQRKPSRFHTNGVGLLHNLDGVENAAARSRVRVVGERGGAVMPMKH